MYLLDELSSMLRSIAKTLMKFVTVFGLIALTYLAFVVLNYVRLRLHAQYCLEPWVWGSQFCDLMIRPISLEEIRGWVPVLVAMWRA